MTEPQITPDLLAKLPKWAQAHIAAWCIYHLGKELPITASKDYSMIELWDDRAVQVIPNTGERADGKQ